MAGEVISRRNAAHDSGVTSTMEAAVAHVRKAEPAVAIGIDRRTGRVMSGRRAHRTLSEIRRSLPQALPAAGLAFTAPVQSRFTPIHNRNGEATKIDDQVPIRMPNSMANEKPRMTSVPKT
jgi:hypothetical protein